jgi:hypothetical protein
MAPLRRSARLAQAPALKGVTKALKAAERVQIYRYDLESAAEMAFQREEAHLDNPKANIRDDLDTLPEEFASSMPSLFDVDSDEDDPKPQSYKRRAKKRRLKEKGRHPTQKTIRTHVDIVDIIHLAGLDAERDFKVVSTAYVGKTDGAASILKMKLDERTLTVEKLKELGLQEVEWDKTWVLDISPSASSPTDAIFPQENAHFL